MANTFQTWRLPDGTTRQDNVEATAYIQQNHPDWVPIGDPIVGQEGPVTQSGGGIPGLTTGGLTGGGVAPLPGIGHQSKWASDLGSPTDLLKGAYNAYQGAVAKPADPAQSKAGIAASGGAANSFAADYNAAKGAAREAPVVA